MIISKNNVSKSCYRKNNIIKHFLTISNTNTIKKSMLIKLSSTKKNGMNT